MQFTGIKPSVKGYLKTRRIPLHPIFILMQLFIAIWVNYKVGIFTRLHMSFVLFTQVFFELIADSGAWLVLFLSCFLVKKQRNFLMDNNKLHLGLAIFSGLIGISLSQLVYCIGLSHSLNPIQTAPWMLTTPMFVITLGLLLKLEKLSWKKGIGITLAFCGCTGMFILNAVTSSYYLLLHALCLAICLLLWRKLMREYKRPPVVVVLWSLGSGIIMTFLAYCLQPEWLERSTLLREDVSGVRYLLGVWFMLSFAYSCNYVILAWATFKTAISVVAIYASARPLLVTTVALLVEQQASTDTLLSCGSLLLIFLGVLICSYR